MPTHLSLPERYPVLEHAEARLGPPRGPGAGAPEAGRSGRGSLLGLLAGGTGGALVVAVVELVAERAG